MNSQAKWFEHMSPGDNWGCNMRCKCLISSATVSKAVACGYKKCPQCKKFITYMMLNQARLNAAL